VFVVSYHVGERSVDEVEGVTWGYFCEGLGTAKFLDIRVKSYGHFSGGAQTESGDRAWAAYERIIRELSPERNARKRLV
jgi:hypothetical protein